MGRTLRGAQPRRSITVSVEESVATALKEIGVESLSAGLELLVKREMARDPEGPFAAVAKLRALRHAELEEARRAIATAAAEKEQRKAERKAGRKLSQAEKNLQDAVAHYMGINDQRIARGEPLYDMSHMSARPEFVKAVYAAATAKYGWSHGPRPGDLGPNDQPPSRIDDTDAGKAQSGTEAPPQTGPGSESPGEERAAAHGPPQTGVESVPTAHHDGAPPDDRTTQSLTSAPESDTGQPGEPVDTEYQIVDETHYFPAHTVEASESVNSGSSDEKISPTVLDELTFNVAQTWPTETEWGGEVQPDPPSTQGPDPGQPREEQAAADHGQVGQDAHGQDLPTVQTSSDAAESGQPRPDPAGSGITEDTKNSIEEPTF